MALTISNKFFGDEAKEIAKRLDLVMSGEGTDVNRKVMFWYKSVEGHPVVTMEMDV